MLENFIDEKTKREMRDMSRKAKSYSNPRPSPNEYSHEDENTTIRVSRRFQEWLRQEEKMQAGEIDEISLSRYEDNEFVYTNEWGEWPPAPERFESARNLTAYIGQEVFEGFLVSEEVEDTSTPDENHPIAYMGVANIQAEHQVLDQIRKYGKGENISRKLALTLLSRYGQALINQGEGFTDPNLRKEFFKSCLKSFSKIKRKILDYEGFRDRGQEETHAAVLFESQMSSQELVSGNNISQGLSEESWIFYSAQKSWPAEEEKIKYVIGSHCPDPEIPRYFMGHDARGGVLLKGEPIKYFSDDMQTSSEELTLGRDWSLEKSIELDPELYARLAEQAGMTYEKYVEDLIDEYKSAVKRSCKEAWEERGTFGYSEIWLEQPIAYAIWIDEYYLEDKRYADNIRSLLTSRPDLPVITRKRRGLSRGDLYECLGIAPEAK